ncbi:signal peptide peptidase SppA [Leptospira santarosai]|uniref:Signal peptide peptidase SppA, 36K type n=2 Tax=Leptospira santarosai TaxID=28183 RepID=A0A0E2BL12_9LEPT|nr:signal peptide peptidase SppA [Leptospira santarosai]EKO31975.1 signal peptide peptidase SppA, 36K type [Leptospira santarosai str. MOR084]EMN23343.1 signal peptide peptidase SppA, 36K type [Leptospira santarosai serovar Arenal str. MAVJ 401]KXZ30216.1 serine protease [Leptospira santarosai]MDI7190780.1 signal peptide peptidase SppA [Leptospira santarosai]MDI7195594.1 signal peptide peptidase SppA [Leptospira santarosai]
MKHSILTWAHILFLSLFLSNCYIPVNANLGGPSSKTAELREKLLSGKNEDKILIIPIDGVISDEGEKTFFGGQEDSILAGVKKQLELAESDPEIKAVILKINSPGGSVTASDILYKEILQFKTKKKIPVVSLFMDTAASGAYYISMATDLVIAHPTSVTGSIGVILSGINVKEGLDKLGVKDQSIRSGGNKTIGSPLEDLSPEQRKLLQSIVDDLFEKFFEVVKNGRPGKNPVELRKIADGRIFTASQALQHGLIDRIGYFDNAVQETMALPNYKKTAGNNSPRIIYYSQSTEKKANFYQVQSPELRPDSTISKILGTGRQVRFLYIWSY